MADPLSLLRQYTIAKRPVVEQNDLIIFGEFAWNKNVKTNYRIYGVGKEKDVSLDRDYYTLECLLFLLKNVTINHPAYVRRAASKNIPIVTRPDRKELLAYLTGKIETSGSIDKNLPAEIAAQFTGRGHDCDPRKAKKSFDHDDVIKAKESLAARLDVSREVTFTLDSIRSLSSELSVEKIAELKTKRLSKKRTTIKDSTDDIELERDVQALLTYDFDVTSKIVSRERQWTDRNSILQSTDKSFGAGILAILAEIERKEKDANRKSGISPGEIKSPEPRRLGPPPRTFLQVLQQPSYSRYYQETLTNDESFALETDGFQINPLNFYSGMSLKKVMEGEALGQPPLKSETLAAVKIKVEPGTTPPVAVESAVSKRVSQTPIIIIPSGNMAMISMLNAQDILEDMRFVSNEEKVARGSKRVNDMLINRQRVGGSVAYRLVDNPPKLSPAEWDRVVAVFVMGPPWQFKGWPWEGNPVEIFHKICAFHLKYDEMKLDANVEKWSVNVMQVSKTKRHLDRAVLKTFWEKLEDYIPKNKPYLKF